MVVAVARLLVSLWLDDYWHLSVKEDGTVKVLRNSELETCLAGDFPVFSRVLFLPNRFKRLISWTLPWHYHNNGRLFMVPHLVGVPGRLQWHKDTR